MTKTNCGLFWLLMHVFTAAALAQSGGGFSIEQSVIASGGGSSSNSSFAIDGTAGQTTVDSPMAGDLFAVRPGFWGQLFAPTAASVSVSGRVMVTPGQGLNGARVICMDAEGNRRVSLTGSFGYFSFSQVLVGEAYLLTIESKRYTFASRTLVVLDEVSDLELFPEL